MGGDNRFSPMTIDSAGSDLIVDAFGGGAGGRSLFVHRCCGAWTPVVEDP